MTNIDISKRVLDLISQDSAFAIIRRPGQSQMELFSGESCNDIIITPSRGCIKDCQWQVPSEPIGKETYCHGIDNLATELKSNGGKSVICRNICGTFKRFAPLDMFLAYEKKFPQDLAFLFYIPGRNFWMGASPELVLSTTDFHVFHTAALAGTRPSGQKESAWSSKNIKEHQIVADGICNNLMSAGYSVDKAETITVNYGSEIQHLRTAITATAPDYSEQRFHNIIDLIHPTSAIWGFPLAQADNHISNLEKYPRQYYSGIISYKHDYGQSAYAILRCVNFNRQRWAIYTGSGITAASQGYDEWLETESKAIPLVDILTQF